MKVNFLVFIFVLLSPLMLQANHDGIEKIAKEIHHHTQKKEDLVPLTSFKNLQEDELGQLQSILALKLLDLERENAKFNSLILGGATIALSAVSLGTYFFAEHLVSENCPPPPSGCPDNYITLSDICYEQGMNAQCAEYYQLFNNVSSIPPYPTYLKDCSDNNVPLTIIGHTIPYTTFVDMCQTEKISLFTVPATTGLVCLSTLSGCIGHGCKYFYKLFSYHKQKKLCMKLKMLGLLEKAKDSGQPLWFKKVVGETIAWAHRLAENSELDSELDSIL
jgi:hypothetical protein